MTANAENGEPLLLPEEVKEFCDQLQREVSALQEQATRATDALQQKANQRIDTIQQRANQEINTVREQMNRETGAIRQRAALESRLRTEEALEAMGELRDNYARAGKVREAAAVAERMRVLGTTMSADVKPDPGNMQALQDRIGESFYFEVVGEVSGPLWGTDIYTSDSAIAKAVVHAGILRIGEKSVIKVTVVNPLPRYDGSTRHGVASSSWDYWPGAYRVEAAI
jgi:hypothetical protein